LQRHCRVALGCLWAHAAFAVVGQLGVGPVPISARGSRNGEGIEAWSAGAAIAGLAKELAAGIPGSKGQFKICFKLEKEPRARYTTKRSTRKRSRLGPGAMSSITLQLSRCWTTSLVVLLVTSSSVVFGEDPSPTVGKYSCSVDNIVGLQTNSQIGTRSAGRIDADAQQRFFVTIEENKQLPEDWCFGADALDDLKKLRRGEKPSTNSKTHFLDPSSQLVRPSSG